MKPYSDHAGVLIRDVRIATLVEAAGLLCDGCRRGCSVESRHFSDSAGPHDYVWHEVFGWCFARPIVYAIMREWL